MKYELIKAAPEVPTQIIELGQIYICQYEGPMLAIYHPKKFPIEMGCREDILMLSLKTNRAHYLKKGREHELKRAEYTLTIKV